MSAPPGSAIPRRVAGWDVDELDGQFFIARASGAEIVHCNQTAAFIWSLCDGRRAVDDIIRLLCEAYPESAARIRADVPAAIGSLVAGGALILEPR